MSKYGTPILVAVLAIAFLVLGLFQGYRWGQTRSFGSCPNSIQEVSKLLGVPEQYLSKADGHNVPAWRINYTASQNLIWVQLNSGLLVTISPKATDASPHLDGFGHKGLIGVYDATWFCVN